MAGFFITFEGVECSGKSLQSLKLVEYCKTHNIPAFLVREPGGTEIGEQLRSILLNQYCTPLAEFFILSASRTQLTETIIKPKLEENYIVISDRYFHSSLAYQGYARGLDIKVLQDISKTVTLGLEPEITFLLKPSYEVARARLIDKKKIGLDRIEQEEEHFHKKIYDAYISIAKDYNYFQIIEGDPDPETIHQEILLSLKKLDSRF